MIEYVEITRTMVKLDKKIIGEIKKVDGGFQYFPKGSKTGGDIFTSLAKCQISLENDE